MRRVIAAVVVGGAALIGPAAGAMADPAEHRPAHVGCNRGTMHAHETVPETAHRAHEVIPHCPH